MNTTLIKKYWKPAAGLIGLILLLMWAAGSFTSKVPAGKVEHRPGIALPAGAATIQVARQPVSARVYVMGTTASEENIHLSSRIPAYVNKVFVSAGDSVKKGQALVVLDDREIREQLTAAQAQLKQAETEYQRTKQLFESKATTDQALIAAESMFNSAKAQVDRIQVMLTYSQIISPIDGVVTDRRIEAGDLANPGQVLLTVYDPTRMRLEAPVPVRLVDKLSLDRTVDISLETPAQPFKGRVSEIVSEIDPLSRTRQVRVHIDEADGRILPGTFGRLWVNETPHEGVVVPATAVYRVGQLQLVQVVENNRVIRRLVSTGQSLGEQIEILSGLEGGEQILAVPVKEG
jgi:RND family efflux transporter MFP subunit